MEMMMGWRKSWGYLFGVCGVAVVIVCWLAGGGNIMRVQEAATRVSEKGEIQKQEVCGRVVDEEPDLSEENFAKLEAVKTGEEWRAVLEKMYAVRPASGVRVTLRGEKQRLEALTDSKGRFGFNVLSEDKKIEIIVEKKEKDRWMKAALLRDEVDPADINGMKLTIRADLIVIRGRVLDSSGRPVEGVEVVGQDAEYPEAGPMPERRTTVSGADGAWELLGFKPAHVYTVAGFLNGGDPGVERHHFNALIEVKREEVQVARRVVPLVRERELVAGRRLLKVMFEMVKREGRKVEVGAIEERKFPESQGNAITGVDIVLEK